ncbi:MAG: hypothetical protein GXP55_07890, partial [Deltaproteobacteria bacterium]|nr:hypothetical protein [Deltaproteobacteria bacterium]
MTGAESELGTPEVIAQSGAVLRGCADVLRRADDAALDELVAAMQRLTGDAERVEALVQSTGLSEPVVRVGLSTSFETFTRARLRGLRERATGWRQNATRLAAVVLAGNVFTAGARALLVPLVLGVPVVAKASSRDSVFPRALAAALPEPFRGALRVHVFPGGDAACERALFAQADVIHAYGADATLRALRERAPASALFVPHGHGLGLAYVDGFSLEDVEGLARDIVAYDQRGCLSPLEVLVKGEGDEAERFAASLHAALSELDASMPRQPLGPAEAAAHAQWRGVAVATGRLLEGAGHALAVEGYARMP